MNRREMLKVSGFSSGRRRTGQHRANFAERFAHDTQAQDRDYRRTPGDPEYGCGGTIARLTAVGTKSCCCT